MKDNKSTLTEEQKKLCHELTMEYIRENNLFYIDKDEKGKTIHGFAKINTLYFSIYEEFAIVILENWNRID